MERSKIIQLLESVYSKADYNYLFIKAEEDPAFFYAIWKLSEEMPAEKAWRLLWILDHATEKNKRSLLPILGDLYPKVLSARHEGYVRIGMKLILRCPLLEDYIPEFLERCIEWIQNPKAKISSQTLGLEFFYQVCRMYPEMAPELLAYIDDILERDPSPGFRVRLKAVRKELNHRSEPLE